MGKRGRPAKGAGLVEHVEGSEAARCRLTVILRTLAGQASVGEACALLGVGRSRFHAMRRSFLAQAARLLEPRPRGKIAAAATAAAATDPEIQRLRGEVVQLKFDLRAAQVREEIALLMPHLLRTPTMTTTSSLKKTVRRASGRPTPSADMPGDFTGSAG
jgi:hypothetical protein